MSEVLTSGGGRLPIKWDLGDTFDVVFEVEENLPLSGSFQFIVENADLSNAASGTCTITDVGVPDVSPGKIRVQLTPLVMKTLVGKEHTHSATSLQQMLTSTRYAETRSSLRGLLCHECDDKHHSTRSKRCCTGRVSRYAKRCAENGEGGNTEYNHRRVRNS